jgi:hypothetical protein
MKLTFVVKAVVCHAIIGLVLPFSIETETNLVRKQLGYLPSNFVSVSAWTLGSSKEPVAIKTYPLHGGAKRRQAKAEIAGASISSPFPTLYWLSCPEISRAVADLERRGFIQEFETKLKAEPELCLRLRKCHEEYAADRWNSLFEEDRSLLCNEDDPSVSRMRNMMQNSGISGTNFTVFEDDEMFVAPIKCLHAHYAHYRSTMASPKVSRNPVGEMIQEHLTKEFPELQL